MDPNKLEYLSETELERLIMEVEEREMLQAPSYLKREILRKIQRKYYPIVPIQKKNKKALLIYRIKVGMAAAAAILLLCILPEGEIPGNERMGGAGSALMEIRALNWEPGESGSSRVARHLKEASDQICQTLNEISGWLISGEY